ncbi:hypothetical protein [uncultured Cellulomonas sp.]|uniref:hypothetical protein n=1 Tax=uncultured Cellulomonas sp. TaxID=189682 RepID=UPI00260DB14F|nr:hypothetical protein [uncultured Cellulomonas sp.]
MVQVRKTAVAAPLALAASMVLVGCSDDSAGPEQGASVEDVAEAEPDDDDMEGPDLLGQQVTVSGEATEYIDPSAFVIGGDALGGDGALVLSSSGALADVGTEITEDTVGSDAVLQVTGTVEELVVVDLEEEYGVDFDDEALEEWEGDAVIVADQIATLPGETLTLAGNVTNLLSTVSFQLAGSGWTVVVLDAAQAEVEPGEYVQVQGTVRQLDIAELEEEFGTDLDDAVYEPYVGDLVLVAEDVMPAEPMAATE